MEIEFTLPPIGKLQRIYRIVSTGCISARTAAASSTPCGSITTGRHGRTLSERGRLVGNRCTVIEWPAETIARTRTIPPGQQYLSLPHALTSFPNAERFGIKAPATPEETLLSKAERSSSQSALEGQLLKSESRGRNRYLRGEPCRVHGAGAQYP